MKSIGIIEDNINLRNSIADFLVATGNYEVLFSVPSYQSFQKLDHTVHPDFILLDIHLEDKLGVEFIDEIRNTFPDTHVLVMTGDKDNDILYKAIADGATGYLNKPFRMGELEEVLNKLEQNGSFLEPKVLTKLFSRLNNRDEPVTEDTGTYFTPREAEIIKLLKNGLSYKQISDKLHVSYHTVNYHMKNIYLKTEVNSRAELMVCLLKVGSH